MCVLANSSTLTGKETPRWHAPFFYATGHFPFKLNLTNISRLGRAGTLQDGRLKDDHRTTYPVPLFTGSCLAEVSAS